MKQRIISAIIMLLIFIPIIIMGGWPFYFLILLIGMISLHELLKFKPKIPIVLKLVTYILTTFILILGNINSYWIIFLLLVYLSMIVFINNQEIYNYQDTFYLLGITLFIGISFHNFIYIRNLDLNLFIYLFLITIGTDTFALLTGKYLGKHKLAPKISPNKTIEGLIGGSLIGTLVASLFYILVIHDLSIILVILLTLGLSFVGQIGDLIKSSIKRYENIKDFSNLIPGHGGILDRFDSIIFVMMTYILIKGLF